MQDCSGFLQIRSQLLLSVDIIAIAVAVPLLCKTLAHDIIALDVCVTWLLGVDIILAGIGATWLAGDIIVASIGATWLAGDIIVAGIGVKWYEFQNIKHCMACCTV